MKDKFNENLREARLRKKLTQQQVAGILAESRFRVPKSIPIVSSFQIKKPRKTPNTASYGVFYLPAAGVEPAPHADK